MKQRERNPLIPMLGVSATLLLLLATLLIGSAPADGAQKTKKLPLLYKGNGYKLKPGLIYGWDPDGTGEPTRYLGKISRNAPPKSAVTWSKWGKTKAIGSGRAWSYACQEFKCGSDTSYPWNGSKVRVIASRARKGHFTRMRVVTPVRKTHPRYYELKLAFRGPLNSPAVGSGPRGTTWRIISETEGTR